MAIDPITQTVIVSIIVIVVFLLVCMFLLARDFARRQQRREDVYEERLSDARVEVKQAYQEYAQQGITMQDKYHEGMKDIVKEMASVAREMKTMSFSFRRALDHLPPPTGDEE